MRVPSCPECGGASVDVDSVVWISYRDGVPDEIKTEDVGCYGTPTGSRTRLPVVRNPICDTRPVWDDREVRPPSPIQRRLLSALFLHFL